MEFNLGHFKNLRLIDMLVPLERVLYAKYQHMPAMRLMKHIRAFQRLTFDGQPGNLSAGHGRRCRRYPTATFGDADDSDHWPELIKRKAKHSTEPICIKKRSTVIDQIRSIINIYFNITNRNVNQPKL